MCPSARPNQWVLFGPPGPDSSRNFGYLDLRDKLCDEIVVAVRGWKQNTRYRHVYKSRWEVEEEDQKIN